MLSCGFYLTEDGFILSVARDFEIPQPQVEEPFWVMSNPAGFNLFYNKGWSDVTVSVIYKALDALKGIRSDSANDCFMFRNLFSVNQRVTPFITKGPVIDEQIMNLIIKFVFEQMKSTIQMQECPCCFFCDYKPKFAFSLGVHLPLCMANWTYPNHVMTAGIYWKGNLKSFSQCKDLAIQGKEINVHFNPSAATFTMRLMGYQRTTPKFIEDQKKRNEFEKDLDKTINDIFAPVKSKIRGIETKREFRIKFTRHLSTEKVLESIAQKINL